MRSARFAALTTSAAAAAAHASAAATTDATRAAAAAAAAAAAGARGGRVAAELEFGQHRARVAQQHAHRLHRRGRPARRAALYPAAARWHAAFRRRQHAHRARGEWRRRARGVRWMWVGVRRWQRHIVARE